jgi:signal transduction histidine kinase
VVITTLRTQPPAVVGRAHDSPLLRENGFPRIEIVLEDDLHAVARRYLLRMKALALVRRHAVTALVLALAVLAQFEVWLVDDVGGERLAAAALALVWTLPLLAHRRFPFAIPVGVLVVVGIEAVAQNEAISNVAAAFLMLILVAWLMGSENPRAQAGAGFLVAVAVITVVVTNDPDPDANVWGIVTTAIIAGLIFLAGAAVRTRRHEVVSLKERVESAERERQESARQAAAEERARIARELHDVVAHSMSVMVVQAGGVRRLLEPHQERQREALLAIERTGREALAEMRRMLGVLRRDGDEQAALVPQPGLDHLHRLVGQVREAGLPVKLQVEGVATPLPLGIDLSAYRVVQEGLTNALKHAGRATAEVTLRYGDGDIEIVVADDGAAAPNGNDAGHGLVGMRERVALYGGTLEAGPRPGGGYSLRVTLPVEVPEA